MRVWLPDRPGALGAVASRIGAVRGDVVGIEILERGAGRAIDELAVQLPDASLVSLLVAEIAQVDGVDVEDVRPAHGVGDPRLDALETAALLVAARTPAEVIDQIVGHAARDFDSDWCVVLDPAAPSICASSGEAPSGQWLSAFLAGSRSASSGGEAGPDDIAWADLATTGLALVLGRKDRPFRSRERRQLEALVGIAGQRWAELTSSGIALAR